MNFKIRVVKNIGEISKSTFGDIGTTFNVKNGRFRDLDKNFWNNAGKGFFIIDEINKYFGDDDCYETEFELVEDNPNEAT